MKIYKSKDELKKEIEKSYKKYIDEFDDIPNKLKNKKNLEVDRTSAENLAYQEKTPCDKFKWNQLGDLYQWFTNEYTNLSLLKLKEILSKNIGNIYHMIDNMTEDE